MKIKRSELKQLAIKHIGNNSLVAQNQIMLKIATARCARISYETLGDNPKIDYEADIKLHDMLMQSKHWSPFEHCARAMSEKEYNKFVKGEMTSYFTTSMPEEVYYNGDNMKGWCNNFRGFIQYRHLIEKH
jgi:thymidylate synthase ThyX